MKKGEIPWKKVVRAKRCALGHGISFDANENCVSTTKLQSKVGREAVGLAYAGLPASSAVQNCSLLGKGVKSQKTGRGFHEKTKKCKP